METQTTENSNQDDDMNMLLQNWRDIPVISTQILMNTFPYVSSPWDHWNQVVDIMKERHSACNVDCVQKK